MLIYSENLQKSLTAAAKVDFRKSLSRYQPRKPIPEKCLKNETAKINPCQNFSPSDRGRNIPTLEYDFFYFNVGRYTFSEFSVV